MKKFNSQKNIIIALIVAIIIIFLVTYTAFERNNKNRDNAAQGLTNDVVGMVDRAISWPLHMLHDSFRSVDRLFNTYEENDRLKKRIDELAALQSENKNYKAENEHLKEQLNLNATLTNYDKVSASVISRSPDSWQEILIIDKGKKDGVNVNMPVMGNKGLIGRVILADQFNAKVELLTAENQKSNHFPVMIATAEDQFSYGLLADYDEKNELFIVTQLTQSKRIKVGDTVATSGLGGNSPKGLPVGKVVRVEPNSNGLDKKVYVKPESSMYDVSAVTVIQRLAGSEK